MNAENQVADQVAIRDNKLSLVERLADDLAHEIKNPLHSMVINLEVLRRRLARMSPDLNADLLRYTGILNAELERVNQRIDLLLSMVRPTHTTEDLVTLDEILDEIYELARLECERYEIHLEIQPSEASPGARFPRAAARQMILSLILRTLDSLSPGATLAVTASSERGRVRLYFAGADTAGRQVSSRHPEDRGNYLSVARALAEELGGDVEDFSGSAVTPRHRGCSAQYILSLPVVSEGRRRNSDTHDG